MLNTQETQETDIRFVKIYDFITMTILHMVHDIKIQLLKKKILNLKKEFILYLIDIIYLLELLSSSLLLN